MTKIKNFALAVALATLASTTAFGQAAYPVSGHVGSDTAGSVAALIKYVGSTAGSVTTDVEVEADGDFVFRVAGVASTTVNSAGLCGAVVGTMDAQDADCNTFGEFVDIVNATADWRMVLVSALRADLIDNTIATLAVASAQVAEGIPLYFDSTVSLTTSIALIPENCKTNIRCFLTPAGKLLENPFAGQQTDVRWVEGYSTFATTGTFNIYSRKVSNKARGAETVTTLWSEVTGASTVNKQLTQFQYFGLLGKPHEQVIVRITDTGASSAFILHAYGVRRDVR